MAFLQDGRVLQRLSSSDDQEGAGAEGGLLPALFSVDPPCACGSSGPFFSLLGRSLLQGELEVVCRSAGRHLYPAVAVQQRPLSRGGEAGALHQEHGPSSSLGGQCADSSPGAAALGRAGLQRIRCQLPPLQGCHLVLVEVCRQGYLSAALALLLLEDAALAAELCRCLSSAPSMTPQEREALLRDVAAVLQHQQHCQHCQHEQPCGAADGLVQAAACRVAAFSKATGSAQLAACVLPLLLEPGCCSMAVPCCGTPGAPHALS